MIEIIRSRPKVGPRVFTYLCTRPAPLRRDRPRRIKGERYPFSLQGWTRQWKQALLDAKIDDFRFHDLRHTMATRVLRASKNLKAVQSLLNHSDIATTARYAHVVEDDLRAALDAATDAKHEADRTREADEKEAKKA
jgi:integrase